MPLIDGVPLTDLYPFSALTERLPRRAGKSPSRKTVERWRRLGRRDGGRTVRLRACRLNGLGWFTCDRWVTEFFEPAAAAQSQEPVAG
jgi:hypothetical protein